MSELWIIPTNWKWLNMKDVVTWSSGGTPKATESTYYENGTISWLITADLNENIVLQSQKKITKLGYDNSSAKMVPFNAVLIAMYGSIGKLGIAGIDCCTNQAIAFTKYLKCDYKFLFYYLRTIKAYLLSLGKGGTQQNISLTVLNSLTIPVPPTIEEQKQIVERLEARLEKLNTARQKLEKIPLILKRFRQSVLASACDGRLTNQKYDTVALENIIRETKIGPFGSLLHATDYIDDGVPVINPKHIKNQKIIPDNKISISNTKLQELKSYILNENDIIMARRGEMGRTATITKKEHGWICGTGSLIFRLKNGYNANLYSIMLSSEETKSYLLMNCAGSTMNNLNVKIVSKIPVYDIPLPEQEEIVRRVDKLFAIADSIENHYNNIKTKLDKAEKSLYAKAFRGEL